MTAPGEYDDGDPDDDGRRATSIWPHVEEQVVDLVEQHRSTIVFANSRRLAERLTARLNEIAADRAEATVGTPDRRPLRPAPRPAGAGDGAVRAEPRGPAGDRQGAPRLGVQGAAGADRGRPQARPAALRGGHQQPRARHRHGRGRPGRADRVAAQRRQRAAAGRPGRAPGRRGVARGAVPQAPRRPRADRGRRRADAHRGDRVAARSRPTRSTCWPSRSSRPPRWTPGTSTSSSRWCGAAPRSPACPRERLRRDAGPAERAATPPTSSPSCGPGSSGTG